MTNGTMTRFLRSINHWPDRTIEIHEDLDQFLTHCGFTIYRTYYGPDSDQRWSTLLQKITDGVAEGLRNLEKADKNPDDVTKALHWFRIDARSDPTMDGLSIQDVRHYYLSGEGGPPMNTEEGYPWRLCLWAEDEVLKDPDLKVVKVVEPDRDHVRARPRNKFSRPQRYYGWMSMPATAVMNMYIQVDSFSFEYLAT
jgi:hypothetical protein